MRPGQQLANGRRKSRRSKLSGGADLPTRIADIDNGTADVIAVASMSLANPDLVERIKTNAPLNAPDPSTFYGGGTKGYTDYPTLAMTAHQ